MLFSKKLPNTQCSISPRTHHQKMAISGPQKDLKKWFKVFWVRILIENHLSWVIMVKNVISQKVAYHPMQYLSPNSSSNNGYILTPKRSEKVDQVQLNFNFKVKIQDFKIERFSKSKVKLRCNVQRLTPSICRNISLRNYVQKNLTLSLCKPS